MFQNIKNKVFSTVANCLRPHLQEKQKEETVVIETTGTKVIQHGERYCSQDCKMTPEKAQELLKLSFQRGPEDFLITKPGQTGYAMDAESPDCHLAQKNMFGLNGAASSVIYSFFAKHGFIGWQLCAMLSQHWLINRACRLPNEDALANGWTLEWQKQDETLDDVEADKRAELLTLAVERGNQSFDLAEKALKFGINRSIYGQALAYFIIEGEDPSTPLNLDGIQPKSFKGITVVEPYWAFPDWGEDAMTPGSLNFYRPEFYTVGGKRIHRSRLCVKTFVEVPDILKPSYYFGGVPLTQMIYERTYAAEKTANEVPELALTKRMLVADANLEEAMANPQVLRQKMEILAHFRNNNGVYFKDRPESVTQLDTNLSDLDANVWTQYQLVASVASIPADRLLCTSPKGFQSTGEYERKTYAQTLQASYQEVAFREFLETALALILKSEFGVADPITLIFNPIDSPTEAERAQTQLVQANRDAALINAGIISAEEAREALAADKGSGYSNLPAEMPKSAEIPDFSDLFGNNEEDKPEGEENGGNGENGAGTDTAADAQWEESKHKRDSDGKFASNGDGSGTNNKDNPNEDATTKNTFPPLKDFLGKEHTGLKGQSAVEKLLQEKEGHVKGAFYREDIGEIDLVWGDEKQGIAHLIKSRTAKSPYKPEDILDNLTETIEKGVLRKGRAGTFEIWHKGIMVIVRGDYLGEDIRFVVTGFKQRSPNKNSITRKDAI